MSKHISPDKIFEIASGYEKSMILFVAHNYDIFSVISNKPATATEVANEIKTNAQATRLLLNALCGLDLLNKRGDRYSNTPIAQRFLVKRKPSYIGNMVKEIERGMASWLRLRQSIKTGKKVSKPLTKEEIKKFVRGMHENSLLSAQAVSQVLDLKEKRKLLDVGGGSGAYSIVLVQKNPGLQATVFDLPEVAEIAREIVAEHGLAERVRVRAGDAVTEEFGTGYDVVLFSQVMCGNEIEVNKKLIRKAFEALKDGGIIAIVDYLYDEEHLEKFPTFFALNMLVLEGGRTFSLKEFQEWIIGAGFKEFRCKEGVAGPASLITAKKCH